MKIFLVVGTRPNFIKAGPLLRAIKKYKNIECTLIHTGQHYDFDMSGVFFDDLETKKPDVCLDIGPGSHIYQLATIMTRFEQVCLNDMPDMVMVVGDVNSTLACALVASRLSCELAHIEAGSRSFDLETPEEMNRVLTDRLSNYLFTISDYAMINLDVERIRKGVYLVGDIMIDSLLYNLPKVEKILTPTSDYILFTLHRAGNVDNKNNLERVLDAITNLKHETAIDIVFPMHPRTRHRVETFGLNQVLSKSGISVSRPKGYLEMLALIRNAKLVITDSGGLQVEAMVLKTPCLTLGDITGRPETLDILRGGTNSLVGANPYNVINKVNEILNTNRTFFPLPKLCDGHAAERIMAILNESNN